MEKDWKEKERKRNGKEGKGRVSKLKGRLAPGAEGMDAAGPYLNLCKKNCSVYIQYKGDIVVVDIKQHKSQFKNSNFTITQSAKFF